MPSPYARTVRFADVDETHLYSSTPSPTFSSTSTLSTDGPYTPPSATREVYSPSSYTYRPFDNGLADGDVKLHEILLFRDSTIPKFDFDISRNPSTSPSISSSETLTYSVLRESAVIPPLPSMKIMCRHLPWHIDIFPSSRGPNAHVTVGDVLNGLYHSLRLPITREEYDGEPAARRAQIAAAYNRRCERLNGSAAAYQAELNKGVKRIDFLCENTRFMGLSPFKDGPNLQWKLSVADLSFIS